MADTGDCSVCDGRGIVYDRDEERMVPCGGLECTVSPGSLIAICHTHGLVWDIDFDPPQCDCEYDLLIVGDE